MDPTDLRSQPPTGQSIINPTESLPSPSQNLNPQITPGPLTEASNPSPLSQPSEFIQTLPAAEPAAAEKGTEEKPKRNYVKPVILGLIALILIGLASSVYAAYAIAYEKIELKNKKLQFAVTNFVMSLPLTPKTPKFLLTKSILEQGKVTSNTFDISLAIKTSQTNDLLGLNQIDFQIKGAADYKDVDNINTSFNASWGKDFNFDLTKIDKIVYFKVNTIPTSMLNLVGVNSDILAPFLNEWVSYDTSSIDTEASKFLEEKEKEETEASYEEVLNSLDDILDKKITDAIEVTPTKENSFDVYKMTLSIDDEMVDYLAEKIKSKAEGDKSLYLQNQYSSGAKLSDQIKNLTIEIYIDKGNYWSRKMLLAFDVIPSEQQISQIEDSNILGESTSALNFLQSKISVAMVAVLDKFGEAPAITPPVSYMTFEEFSNKFREVYPTLLALPTPSPSPDNE